jgi:hypothetical protein
MPLTIGALERTVRSAQDVRLLEQQQGRWGCSAPAPMLLDQHMGYCDAPAVLPLWPPGWLGVPATAGLLTLSRTPGACCRDDRYFLAFTPPGGASSSSSSGSSSDHGSWVLQRLRPPHLPWQAAQHAGSVRVCLR